MLRTDLFSALSLRFMAEGMDRALERRCEFDEATHEDGTKT